MSVYLSPAYLEIRPALKAALEKHNWTVEERIDWHYLILENENGARIGYHSEGFYGNGFHTWCNHCLEEIKKDDETEEHNSQTICQDCYDELQECYSCGCLHWDTTTVEGEEYCESCHNGLPYCNICNETVSSVRSVDSHDVCVACFEELPDCKGCNQTVLEVDEDGYCSYCAEENKRKEKIHRYGYVPKFLFHGKGPIFFGIELEVQGDQDTAIGLRDFISPDFLYCKEDSSIGGGFEIVSHPADWNWLMEHKEKWNKLLKHLQNNQMKSYDANTCGLHVHVSRNPLGPLTKYKIQKLIYENSNWWKRVADRNNPSAASFEEESDRLIIKKSKGELSPNRYVAVNFSDNVPTIEFRLFKGTLHKQSFWRKLESVQACILFCRESSIKNIKVNRFIDWIIKNKKDYPELYSWIKGKDLPETKETLCV